MQTVAEELKEEQVDKKMRTCHRKLRSWSRRRRRVHECSYLSSRPSNATRLHGRGSVLEGSGQRMVDRSGQPDVTRNVIEAHSTFYEDSELSTLTIDQGNLMSVTARTHRLGLYLKSKDR